MTRTNKGIVNRLRVLINGLKDTAKILGLWPVDQARREEEGIEYVANVESLELIRHAASPCDVSNVTQSAAAANPAFKQSLEPLRGAGGGSYSDMILFCAVPPLTDKTRC